jgi:hypothetical protein
MVHHIFLITQELLETGQLETQIAIGLARLCWTVSADGFRLELPLRLSRIHASNEGREQRGVVVVDQRRVAAEGFLVLARTLYSHPDLRLDLFMRSVLRNQVLKLESQRWDGQLIKALRCRGSGTYQLEKSNLLPKLGVSAQTNELGFAKSLLNQSTRGVLGQPEQLEETKGQHDRILLSRLRTSRTENQSPDRLGALPFVLRVRLVIVNGLAGLAPEHRHNLFQKLVIGDARCTRRRWSFVHRAERIRHSGVCGGKLSIGPEDKLIVDRGESFRSYWNFVAPFREQLLDVRCASQGDTVEKGFIVLDQ